MSYQEYKQSQEIERRGYDFYALIMAAMRKADTDNTVLLQEAFPDTWNELADRCRLPGGKYPAEQLRPFPCVLQKLKEE